MARVIPSPASGLSEAAGRIFEAVLAKRRLEQEDRRLDISDRVAALNSFGTLASFAAPGTKLGDLGPDAQLLFGKAFESDPSQFAELELNPETIQTMFQTKTMDFMREPEGEQLVNTLFSPFLRELAGLPAIPEEEKRIRTNARFVVETLEGIRRDPELMKANLNQFVGQNPTEVVIPAVGDRPEIRRTLQSPTSANIFAQFMMLRDETTGQIATAQSEELEALIKEVKDAVQLSGFSIGSPAVRRVLGIYNNITSAGPGEREEIVTSFMQNPGVTDGEKLALQFLEGSIVAGELAQFQNLPGGQAFIKFVQGLNQLEGLPIENRDDVYALFLDAFQGAGGFPTAGRGSFGLGRPRLTPFFGGGLQLNPMTGELEPKGEASDRSVPGQVDVGGPPAEFSLDLVPDSIKAMGISLSLRDGVARDSLVQEFGEDLVAQAEDLLPGDQRPTRVDSLEKIDPSSVGVGSRTKARQMNLLIDQANRGGISQDARDRLRRKIAALRAEIESG